MTIAGLILAGGESRRMGRDKALLPLAGRPMIEHVLAKLSPQVGRIAVSANGDSERLSSLGIPVLADDEPGTGPLAGVLAGLTWAQGLDPQPRYLVTAPVDSPFLPRDLVARLAAGADGSDEAIVIAASGDRDHPVVALWPIGLRDRLAEWRMSARSHGVRAFLASIGFTVVTFAYSTAEPDPFLNVNTPEDHAAATGWVAKNEQL